MDQELLLNRIGAVAIVTLNRPDRLNALTLPMVARFTSLMEELNDDPDVRAIVITGAGRGFCSGLDLKENKISKGTWRTAFRAMNFNEHEIARMRSYAKPLIAAVNGVAVGGGLGIALACDIRIGSRNASFCAAFAKHGMPPQDAVAAYLPDAVGLSKAMEMIFTAKTVDSAEALACGLISEVTPNEALLDRAIELATVIASGPPVALALAKQVVYRGRGKPIDEQMALQSLGSFLNKAYAPNDLEEAAAAFAEKRKPNFTAT